MRSQTQRAQLIAHELPKTLCRACTEYRTKDFTLAHMDLYRLSGPDDLLTIGYPEYLESGAVVAVEWPERAGDLIPPDALHVRFSLTDEPETRSIEVSR